MNLFYRATNKAKFFLNCFRLFYIQFRLGNKFIIGINTILKASSRIDVFGERGSIKVGSNFSMGYNSEIYCWEESVIIGNNTSFNDNCKIYNLIRIGDYCSFASNIFISSGTHQFRNTPQLPIKFQDRLVQENKMVIVEDDCWIGFGAVIMPGVYIGKGAIIGANAVVTRDVFPYTVNVGAPSKEISRRLNFRDTYLVLNSSNPQHWPFFYRGFSYSQLYNPVSLDKGLNLTSDIGVILLTKENVRQVKLSGFCHSKCCYELYLDETSKVTICLEVGKFDLKFNKESFEEADFSHPTPLSPKIVDLSTVITIKLIDPPINDLRLSIIFIEIV